MNADRLPFAYIHTSVTLYHLGLFLAPVHRYGKDIVGYRTRANDRLTKEGVHMRLTKSEIQSNNTKSDAVRLKNGSSHPKDV